jgi:hypothetical protein
MDGIHVELNDKRKSYIRGCLKRWEDVEDRDAEDWGIKAGLGWVLHKLNLHEFLNDYRVVAIFIPNKVIDECRKEWKDNAIEAHWNLGYSRAIFSVLKALDIKVEPDPIETPIEYITNYYNK